MWKSKYFKIVCIAILHLTWINGESYAFFSPSSLELLNVSAAPWIHQVLIIILAALMAIAVKIKRNIKVVVICVFSAILVSIGASVAIKYIDLKRLNAIDNAVFIDELKSLSFSELHETDETATILYNKKFQKDRYVGLDGLRKSSYDQFKKISLIAPDENKYSVKDSLYVDFMILWENISNNEFNLVEDVLNGLNIKREDKLLVVCLSGWRSQLASYFLYKEGYNAYYSELTSMTNNLFVDLDGTEKTITEMSAVIDYFEYKASEQYYIFVLNVDEAWNLKYLYPSKKNTKLKRSVTGIRASKIGEKNIVEEFPKLRIVNNENINFKKSKIICVSQLHCLITQHKIASLKLSHLIDKIYFVR